MKLYIAVKYLYPSIYNADFINFKKKYSHYILEYNLAKNASFPYPLYATEKYSKKSNLDEDEDNNFEKVIFRSITQNDNNTVTFSAKKCTSILLPENYGEKAKKFSASVNFNNPVIITYSYDHFLIECKIYTKSLSKINLVIKTSSAVKSFCIKH